MPFDNYNGHNGSANGRDDSDDNHKLQNDYEDSLNHADDVAMRRHLNEGIDRSPPRSRPLSTYSDSMAVPRIVITPTPEDNENRRASWAFSEESNKKTSKPFETFELLSSKLSQLYASSSNLNSNNDDSNHCQTNTMNGKRMSANHQKSDSSQSEDDSDSENESETQSEEASSESEKQHKQRSFQPSERTRNDSLYEIEDIRDTEIHASHIYDMDMHHESDDESADIIEFIIDNGGHPDEMSHCDTVEFNDHLSVIFEEDSKIMSVCSSNSSSVTLANESNSSGSSSSSSTNGAKHIESDEEEEEEDEGENIQEDKEEEEEECQSSKTFSDNNDSNNEESDESDADDDQSTSVTVRLPLRLSFSRSSNDEEITTVMVGKSETKVDEYNDKSCKTPNATTTPDTSADVSVSFCLRPRNQSVSARSSIVETSSNNESFDCEHDDDDDDDEKDGEDSEAEVSVSISLPLRKRTASLPPQQRPLSFVRPTFTRQQTLSPVPRHRDEFEYKVWNRGFSIERDTSIAKSIKPQNQQTNDDTDDESNDMKSMRDRIAAFEAFIPNKNKKELKHQDTFDSSFEETQIEKPDQQQQQRNEPNYVNEFIDQQQYENLPQTTEYENNCDKNDGINVEATNYDSFVTTQCKTYDLQPEPEPEYLDTTTQHFQQQNMANQEHYVERGDEEEEEEEEGGEGDYKANLSVQQKIAAFQQPASNQVPKIDARQEICMARQANNGNNNKQTQSVGDRFLAQVASANQPSLSPSPASHENSENLLHSANATQTNGSLKPSNSKMNGMHLSPYEESELEETDSGVDIHRRVSEDVDTESECYSELRKLTRYERAATHSRLFRILQEYEGDVEKPKAEEEVIVPLARPKKIVHNVSITRRQNPELLKQAESMADRRERLQLGYNSSSIDNDNASSSASPSCASPVSVNEKLIDELVHSVLQQTKRRNLQNIPIEKIQAAARRALIQQNDENDSCDTFSSFDSTPAITPHEFNDDCYDSDADRHASDILPSKTFKYLQEQSTTGRRYKSWAARCPRVLSSKTVNRDLSRVTETRESQTPEREHQYIYPF